MKRKTDAHCSRHAKMPKMKKTTDEKTTMKLNKHDRLSPLIKDLKLKIVSFLTRSEVLTIARCSIRQNRDFTSDGVWKAFIKRISPSLLGLPMTMVTSWRERLRVLLGGKTISNDPVNDPEMFQLHYILNFHGVLYSATLDDPEFNWKDDCIGLTQWMSFDCGLDFGSMYSDFSRKDSIMLLLIYDGMTSVVLPETKLYQWQIDDDDCSVEFWSRFSAGLEIYVKMKFMVKVLYDEIWQIVGIETLSITTTNTSPVTFWTNYGRHL